MTVDPQNRANLIAEAHSEARPDKDYGSTAKADLLERLADTLAQSECQIAELTATIESMSLLVSDVTSDYYGEIRQKFEALRTPTTDTTTDGGKL